MRAFVLRSLETRYGKHLPGQMEVVGSSVSLLETNQHVALIMFVNTTCQITEDFSTLFTSINRISDLYLLDFKIYSLFIYRCSAKRPSYVKKS